MTVPGATQTWVRHPGPVGFVGPDDLRVPGPVSAVGERSLGVLGVSKGRTGQAAFSFGDFLGVITACPGRYSAGHTGAAELRRGRIRACAQPSRARGRGAARRAAVVGRRLCC